MLQAYADLNPGLMVCQLPKTLNADVKLLLGCDIQHREHEKLYAQYKRPRNLNNSC